jgi:SAM-dependent methyltransferase
VTGLDAGSFRDPDSGVSIVDGKVLRGFSAAGAERFDRLSSTSFFPRLMATGQIVRTTAYDGEVPRSPRGDLWARVVEHERVPFVSYPYEWPFTMLQEAAMLQLGVLRAALDEDMSLTDGSAYNVQFVGSRPVFIDIGSFAPASGPWPGYRQFCQTMLFPLLIQAHLGMRFQPLLRGNVDGLSASEVAALFSGLARFRKGVLRNVVLHGVLERRVHTGSEALKRELEASGYSTGIAKATADNLAKLTRGLRPRRRASTWEDYRDTCSYTRADVKAKRDFVEAALGSARHHLVLDLGANDGEYSRLAARHADHVVAVDGDEAVVDALYRSLRAEGNEQILPLVVDLADPPGGLGWRNRERAAFGERIQPDVVLALALVHHLVIAANVPLPEVVEWLRSFGARVVVELVEPTDVQVQRLLANKPPGLFPDYTRPMFERLVAQDFLVAAQESLPSGTRTLYALDPKT